MPALGRLARGLYELLVTLELRGELAGLAPLVALEKDLAAADAADRIALHAARILRRTLDGSPEKQRVEQGAALLERLVDAVCELAGEDAADGDRLARPVRVLHALRQALPDGRPEDLQPPLIPLLDTTLLTNARGEPRIVSQLRAELPSADRVDAVLAFIRRSGLTPLREALRGHCESGGTLRVLTTVYTGSTECEALEELAKLGALVRVSYDTSGTRLHAKSWHFHRANGFSTAFIGSSNLTHSAQHDGLEWNVRISGARNPDVIAKFEAVFESYWHGGEFVDFAPEQFRAALGATARSTSGFSLPPIELRPEPFQEHLLEQLALARRLGHHRNLLVAATGTGKTVMAAIDYARVGAELPRDRLLFVAHRKELLEQARKTFAIARRDAAFGELWVEGLRPERFEHVFASIQSLASNGLEALDPQHFDVVIVDEFHHAAAASYRAVLERLRPRELLGLTATPERSDGLDVLAWFSGRIAAELRLWDAIDQRRLVPFRYFGIADHSDLRAVPWHRGRGYDVDGLTRVLTADDALARHVAGQLRDHVDDVQRIRALGFCVSVAHARFLARVFRESGLKASAIWGDSPASERAEALRDLQRGELNVLFAVDLFNEGVDLPAVDTLLLLRPTESPTLFLQQLGRGLRRHPEKRCCTVLDFVGQHRAEFRYDRRFLALLGGTRSELVGQIGSGFPWLPAGCHLELDAIASERVLASVRAALPTRLAAQIEELRSLRAAGHEPSLAEFLAATGLEPEDVYGKERCWAELQERAGAVLAAPGPHEAALRRGIGRLLHVDDEERLNSYRALLARASTLRIDGLDARTRRCARMLLVAVAEKVLDREFGLQAAWDLLAAHPQIVVELQQLFDVLATRRTHLAEALDRDAEFPLASHARYSRREILAALGPTERVEPAPWREGVRWFPTEGLDVFVFTIDKSSGSFSPTTRYRDYAINRELIHWESQSGTSAKSETGRRYVEHRARGTRVLLFARLHQEERAFHCLGFAEYVRHESERPMQIVWRLERPLPGDLFASFAAAIA
jgi:superfamily II DNA or RNA helicase/HKD family nuclease